MNANSQTESQGSARRRRLFDLFSQNLNNIKKHPKIRVQPDFDEGYICPICFKLFGRDALSTEYDDHLTLEDVPPQSLGGKVLTLTCKICNNRAGTELESHLSKKLHADAFLSGAPGIQMEARFCPDPSVDLTAIVQFMQNRVVDIRYDPNRSNPDDVSKLHEMEDADEISGITLRFLLGYKINRPEVALIRIAYLLAFARFGYGFLINHSLERIRYQIQNSAEKNLPDWGILKGVFPDSAIGISVIYEPRYLQSFLVVFDLKTGAGKIRCGVILPGPTKPGLDVYKRIADLKRGKDNMCVEYKARVIPQDNYLKDPKLTFASHTYWDYFRK
jgi:hypothetical protein